MLDPIVYDEKEEAYTHRPLDLDRFLEVTRGHGLKKTNGWPTDNGPSKTTIGSAVQRGSPDRFPYTEFGTQPS